MSRKENSRGRFEVLVDFTDAEDSMTVYIAGKDKYPRVGYDPSDDRIAYLQSSNTALGKPVIAKK